MGDNSYPMMLHKGHDRIIVNSPNEQELAEADGYGRHHSQTAKKVEAKEAQAEQLGDAPVRNDDARMEDLKAGVTAAAKGETVVDEAGHEVAAEGSGVTTETLAELKDRVAAARSVDELEGMRLAEERHPKYDGGRRGALEAIDRRIAELRA